MPLDILVVVVVVVNLHIDSFWGVPLDLPKHCKEKDTKIPKTFYELVSEPYASMYESYI